MDEDSKKFWTWTAVILIIVLAWFKPWKNMSFISCTQSGRVGFGNTCFKRTLKSAASELMFDQDYWGQAILICNDGTTYQTSVGKFYNHAHPDHERSDEIIDGFEKGNICTSGGWLETTDHSANITTDPEASEAINTVPESEVVSSVLGQMFLQISQEMIDLYIIRVVQYNFTNQYENDNVSVENYSDLNTALDDINTGSAADIICESGISRRLTPIQLSDIDCSNRFTVIVYTTIGVDIQADDSKIQQIIIFPADVIAIDESVEDIYGEDNIFKHQNIDGVIWQISHTSNNLWIEVQCVADTKSTFIESLQDFDENTLSECRQILAVIYAP